MAIGGTVGADEDTCGYALDPEDPTTWPSGVTLDPEFTSSEELPTCRHESLDGHDRCGLHLPIEDRPEDFDEVRAVRERLKAVTDPNEMTTGPGGTVSFVGARLTELDLTVVDLDVEGLRTLDLRFARIEGTLSLASSTVPQQLHLDGAAIGQFDARRATFEREITLDRARVGRSGGSTSPTERNRGAIHFPRATVASSLSLRRATIEGDVMLSEMASLPRLLAMNAEIDGTLSLDGTDIVERTALTDLSCQQLSATRTGFHGAELSGLDVQSTAQFDYAEFWGTSQGDVKLMKADFRGDASFERTTFHTPAKLGHLTVAGALELRNAEFHGRVDAENWVIRGAVSGSEAEFHAELHCKASRFDDAVDLRRAMFEGETRFDETVFEGKTFFDRAAFTERVAFDGGEFATDCFFRNTVRTPPTQVATPSPSNPDSDASGGNTEPDPEPNARASPETEREPATDGGLPGSRRSPVGVFHDTVSFRGMTARGKADFRILDDDRDPNERFSPETDIVPGATTVEGDFDAAGARFADADFAGFSVTGSIDLREATLSRANLRKADLRAANLERATLSHANLFAAELEDAKLHGAVFDGTRIDDRTEFSDEVVYHERAIQTPDSDGKVDWLDKAISVYSQLETLARDNGQSEIARTMFVGRKDAERQKIPHVNTDRRLLGFEISGGVIGSSYDFFRYSSACLKKAVMNYGENYLRVIVSSAFIIVVFGAAFPVVDLGHSTAGQIAYHGPITRWLQPISFGILYSLSSFTALGVAGFDPGPGAEALAVVESAVGIVMFGLFLFVLQRRTAR